MATKNIQTLLESNPIDTYNRGHIWQEGYILRNINGNIQFIRVFYDPVDNSIFTEALPPEIRDYYKKLPKKNSKYTPDNQSINVIFENPTEEIDTNLSKEDFDSPFEDFIEDFEEYQEEELSEEDTFNWD